MDLCTSSIINVNNVKKATTDNKIVVAFVFCLQLRNSLTLFPKERLCCDEDGCLCPFETGGFRAPVIHEWV